MSILQYPKATVLVVRVYYTPFVILGFVTIGTVFDVGVWYFVKDVKIFDEEIELEDIAEEPGETL